MAQGIVDDTRETTAAQASAEARAEQPRRSRKRRDWVQKPDMRVQPNSRNRFGIWLHDQMVQKGWDVLDLAGRTRMSHSTIYKLLEFEDPSPDPPTCLRLAKALEVPVIELYAVLGYLDAASKDKIEADIDAQIRVREHERE